MRHAMIFVLASVLIGALSPASAQWTEWFDRDNPSGKGDFETLKTLIEEGNDICPNMMPDKIQCRTVFDNVDFLVAGEDYSWTPERGGICLNANQLDDMECEDYKVRFRCGEDLTATASPELDYGCSRNGIGYQATVTLDIQGGAEPYTCHGPAANLPLVTNGDQCVATGVAVGAHVFKVTDSAGDSVNVCVEIEDVIEIAQSTAPASCCSCADGAATVGIEGKNPPFTVRWNPPLDVVGPTVTGVEPGTYEVLVTDAIGCFQTLDVDIDC